MSRSDVPSGVLSGVAGYNTTQPASQLVRPPIMAKNIFRVALRGDSILTNPRWNKGSAFTTKERVQFGLVGRLPHQVNTLDQQCRRAYDQLLSRDTPLRKNSFLQSLKEQNTVLFYQLLRRHLKELIPIVYTPTEACARYIPCFLDY